MHYARQCGSYNKWCDHNSAAAIRKPHCLTGSHTQFHAEDFLSYIYVSRCNRMERYNRPRRFDGTYLFWKQIKKGESTNRASAAILNTKADPGPARRAPPPPCLKKGTYFVNLHCIYANTLILVNMQCLQYIFYSLFF